MSIWQYSHRSRYEEAFFGSSTCPFCAVRLHQCHNRTGTDDSPPVFASFSQEVRGCQMCGWWRAQHRWTICDSDEDVVEEWATAASLINLDLRDISLPLRDVRSYLRMRYDKRFILHPTLAEHVVASVFRGLGYDAVAVGRSGDGGIDVILEDNVGRIGVQVRRYRGSIGVDQIRELTGALCLQGLTRGIFVTTSRFARGAQRASALAKARGYAIDLVDAPRFFEMLGIAQESDLQTWDPSGVKGILDELACRGIDYLHHATFARIAGQIRRTVRHSSAPGESKDS